MSDISITITSDPTQAVTDINKVKKAADDLATTSKKVAESSAADNTQAINQVLTVSRQAQQAVSQTGTAVGAVSTGIKQAANDAAKVSGAFGQAVPVIGRLGSAIASAITGPIGAISAAIGLAIAGIQKMISYAEDRVNRLKMQAGTQSNSAYDKLIQGRTQYAEDLKTLEQIKQIQSVASQSALSASELAQFRQLAAQLGIEERYVGERGIRSGKIAEAEKSLNHYRAFYADQDYQQYLEAAYADLQKRIDASKINDEMKTPLKRMSLFEAVDAISSRARRGAGNDLDEYKAYQELYPVVKQIAEVRASYNRDAMLGRSQADLNAAAVASITGAHPQTPDAASGGSAGAPKPGTWAWQKEQDKKAMAAAEAERKEQERRNAAAAGLTEKLQQEIEIQTMINDGRQREADILRQRISLESALGRQLTTAEQASIEQLAGTLYDLRHPQEPDLAPADPGAPESPARARTRARTQAALPLDHLQRLGANVTNAVSSPEKLTLDRQLSVQEDIRNILRQSASQTYQETVMRF